MRRLPTAVIGILFCGTRAVTAEGWNPNPNLLEAFSKQRSNILSREESVPKYQLPDPLVGADGMRVVSAEQWEANRRAETLGLFSKYVYGRSPGKPAMVSFELIAKDDKAMDGKATLRRVKITSADAAGKSFAFDAALLTPTNASKPVPAFILINN